MGFLKSIGASIRSRLVAGASPRDPVIASWYADGGANVTGVDVTPDNARECPEVDACISLNEDTIATVPLDLFEKVSDGERKPASDHPLHVLLHDTPNEWQTSADFRQMMEGYRETHGNAYARIIPGVTGFPSALEPVHPNDMRPIRQNGKVWYAWSQIDAPTKYLAQSEVLHLRDTPSHRPPYMMQGQSRVTRHAETIGRAIATGRYLSLYFKNYATPKIKIVIPSSLSDEQVEKYRDQFMRMHGQGNMHKPVVNHSGITTEAIGATNDEAQVVPLYEQSVAQIARIFDVPLHLIGETSKSTSWGTGIEQQSIGFVTYYMRSKFVMWEQALNRALMSAETRAKYYFEFNMDALLRGDFKSRMDGYALMIQWGLASPNEIRKLMNFPPVEGGDERIMPLNMVPATRIMDVLLKSPTNPQARMIEMDDATRLLAEIIPLIKGKKKLNGKGAQT